MQYMNDGSYVAASLARAHGAAGGERLGALEASDPLAEDTAAGLAELFQALSDTTRVRIVSVLLDAELCVGDLADVMGMSQSAISHQLRTLRDLRLVRTRREGRQIFYTLDDEHVAALYRTGLDHLTHG
jgi:DNA-binding transcriptional ArsR family regulator